MMPYAVSHEMLHRQHARDLRLEAERMRVLRAGVGKQQSADGRGGVLLAWLRQVFRAEAHSQVRPSIRPIT
jgi:hypothetical protein